MFTYWGSKSEAFAVTLVPFETQVPVLQNLRDRARGYAEASRSANTVRAYEADLRSFRSWCQARGLTCLPASADTVSLYLAAMAETKAPANLERIAASISVAHGTAGYDSPTLHAVVRSVLGASVARRERRKRARGPSLRMSFGRLLHALTARG